MGAPTNFVLDASDRSSIVELFAPTDQRHFTISHSANFTAKNIKFSNGDVSSGTLATTHAGTENSCGGALYGSNAYIKITDCYFGSGLPSIVGKSNASVLNHVYLN